MRRHVLSAALAGLLTAFVFSPFLLALPASHWPRSYVWLVGLLSWTMLPAMAILSLVGVGGGPEGLPGYRESAVLTFALWWAAFDLGAAWWKRRRTQDRLAAPGSPGASG